jgi:PAS domain S-box-containing protein
MKPVRWGQQVLELAGIALIYLVLAKLGLKLALINPSASPVWPATGFALSMVLLRGLRVWPAIFIPALIANATTAGTFLISAAIASGNTLEAVAGGFLIQKYCGGVRAFETPSNVVKFALICAGPASIVSATIGAGSLDAGGFVGPGQFNSVWLTWWMGDLSSALLLTPAIVLWAVSPLNPLDRKAFANTAMLLAVTFIAGMIAFRPLAAPLASKTALEFVAVIPLVWAGLRRGQRDTATAALLIAFLAIWSAANVEPPDRTIINEAFLFVSMFVIGVAIPCLALSADVALRQQAEERLREGEERLRLANEAGGVGTFVIDVEAGKSFYSSELASRVGHPGAGSAQLEDVFARVHRDDTARVRAQYDAALRGDDDGQFKIDLRFVCPGGEIRWMTWAGRVDFRGDGRARVPLRVLGAVVDITDRMRAEEATRASEERFRGIFEDARTAIGFTDLQGRIQCCNRAYASMLGYREDELMGRNFADLIHPEDREENMAEIRRLLAQEIPSFEILNRYIAKNGAPIWVHKHISSLKDASGRPTHILALVMDMSERKRHEDHINLLMREVNHRSKNMLALVQAVARQTLAAKPEEFIERFGARIRALSASQDLLVKSEWKGVNLDELIRSQFGHFEDLIGSRIELKGPPMVISANAAQAIGMALHELATNAGKYGALSNAHGRAEISWDLKPAKGKEGIFVMTWREHDGPAVAAPAAAGFGSTVLRRVTKESLDGEVELDYAADGLVWRLRCRAAEVLEKVRTTQ